MSELVRDQVFLSYSHRDRRWLDHLLTHLRPYVRDGSITAWTDRQIRAGSRWLDEIRQALAKTKVAVLLVTPNFLASDFIDEHELAPLLKEAETGGVTILWIPVRPSSYLETPLKDYQAIIDADKPLAGMRPPKRDETWVEICKTIEAEVSRGRRGTPPGRPLTALLLELEERSRSGELPRSLALKAFCRHVPDPENLRLREGLDVGTMADRVVKFLEGADLFLSAVDPHEELLQQYLGGAALLYAALLYATARSTETWWSVHVAAYTLFTRVLEENYGLRLTLNRKAQGELYEAAIATIEQFRPTDRPVDLIGRERLFELMVGFLEFLEE